MWAKHLRPSHDGQILGKIFGRLHSFPQYPKESANSIKQHQTSSNSIKQLLSFSAHENPVEILAWLPGTAKSPRVWTKNLRVSIHGGTPQSLVVSLLNDYLGSMWIHERNCRIQNNQEWCTKSTWNHASCISSVFFSSLLSSSNAICWGSNSAGIGGPWCQSTPDQNQPQTKRPGCWCKFPLAAP